MELKTQEPNFWGDPENSQNVLKKLKGLKDKVGKFSRLEEMVEEVELMLVLSDESGEADLASDIEKGLKQLDDELVSLRMETFFTGQYDENNAILTLHAGAGGTEAQDWASMLMRMYSRWAQKKGYEVTVTDYLDGDGAGIKSCVLNIKGTNAYGYLKSEHGVHRLVRISPFDAAGRRHTSFASVEVIPEIDDSIDIDIRPEDVEMSTFRSSGAGGQHVNKTDSAVRLVHKPTGIIVSCQTERSQMQNRETAMRMLRSKLYELKLRENVEKIADLKGVQTEIAWGNQIRSYVFCPYTLVKDHRSNYEEGSVEKVMDGEIDGFINAYLTMEFNNKK